MLKFVDVVGVRCLCGMIQYMFRFLFDFVEIFELICVLIWKDILFVWFIECENVFVILKKNFLELLCLVYFDVIKEVVI